MKAFSKIWLQNITIALLFYSVVGGILFEVPRLPILNETIRALYFHVPMWFGMVFLLTASMVYAIRFLKSGDQKSDIISVE